MVCKKQCYSMLSQETSINRCPLKSEITVIKFADLRALRVRSDGFT